ncbi:MAG TPA: hypothetical protein VEI47_02400 [Gemmatimonadales bacterium]|nr:hypothetical protein [Gemmatimonadales bacterium]
MDFEATLKVLISIAAAVAIPVVAYAAVAATRAIWVRPHGRDPDATGNLDAEMEELRARVAELESGQQRLLDLEERMDFTERLLVEARERQLERADTPPEPSPSPR